MKRSQRYLLLIIAGSVVCLLVLLQTRRLGSDRPRRLSVSDLSDTSASTAPKVPKITVIAIWSIHDSKTPVYFPYFFQSVEANKDVDLLFVAVDRAGVGCKSFSSAANVQELCLTENQCTLCVCSLKRGSWGADTVSAPQRLSTAHRLSLLEMAMLLVGTRATH